MSNRKSRWTMGASCGHRSHKSAKCKGGDDPRQPSRFAKPTSSRGEACGVGNNETAVVRRDEAALRREQVGKRWRLLCLGIGTIREFENEAALGAVVYSEGTAVLRGVDAPKVVVPVKLNGEVAWAGTIR